MAAKTIKAAKTNGKATKTPAPKAQPKPPIKTTINAGGGILVDVIEAKAPAKATKPVKPQATDNPYRVGGGYWASVEALKALGVDTLHPFQSIIPAVKAAFGLGWADFKSRDPRNDNGKDAEARIIQNVSVVARKDYGAPLRKLGYEVRFDGRQKVAGLFKIGAAAAVKTVASNATKPQEKLPSEKGSPQPKAAVKGKTPSPKAKAGKAK